MPSERSNDGGSGQSNYEAHKRKLQQISPILDAHLMATRLQREMGKVNVDFTVRPGIVTEIVCDASVAERLAKRHCDLIRSEIFVRAMKCGGQALEEQRRFSRNSGGFLYPAEHYAADTMRERILSPDFVIAEAGDEVTLPSGEHERRMYADVQIRLPHDGGGGTPVFRMPDVSKGDQMYDGEPIYRHIKENPSIAGIVEDICVNDTYAHMGYAAAARSAAIDHIQKVINPHRSVPIEYLAAEMYSISGVELPSGERIERAERIDNVISMIIHLQSREYIGVLASRRKGEDIPVRLPEDEDVRPHKLITDWMTVLQKIKRAD